jgi:hypothetical protein
MRTARTLIPSLALAVLLPLGISTTAEAAATKPAAKTCYRANGKPVKVVSKKTCAALKLSAGKPGTAPTVPAPTTLAIPTGQWTPYGTIDTGVTVAYRLIRTVYPCGPNTCINVLNRESKDATVEYKLNVISCTSNGLVIYRAAETGDVIGAPLLDTAYRNASMTGVIAWRLCPAGTAANSNTEAASLSRLVDGTPAPTTAAPATTTAPTTTAPTTVATTPTTVQTVYVVVPGGVSGTVAPTTTGQAPSTALPPISKSHCVASYNNWVAAQAENVAYLAALQANKPGYTMAGWKEVQARVVATHNYWFQIARQCDANATLP